jgi:hypothetical protein
LDIADMVQLIEAGTGWEFTQAEVKSLYTVGDLQAIVDKKYEADQ